MATAEHREPCDSRGSCTVLGAPGGETPSGDSSRAEELKVSIRSPDEALARLRYGRPQKCGDDAGSEAGVVGHRHGSRKRSLTGTFGKVEITVPRARVAAGNGRTTEWKSQALRP
jgi:hypothetical protein